MQKDLTPEGVVATAAAQGVAIETKSAQNYAAALSVVLKGAAPGYARIAFEEEPAAFVAEQRRNAP
jgi:hypothetical protein